MNDDGMALREETEPGIVSGGAADLAANSSMVTADREDILASDSVVPAAPEYCAPQAVTAPGIPGYLEETYWWAYLRPGSIWLFEREWLVNLILWGNMTRLTNAVLTETDDIDSATVLQVACVYGDFSNKLAERLENSMSRLEIVDIADIQLRNAREKLRNRDNVNFHHQDSSSLQFDDHSFDQSIVFFLLHEQPEDVRRQTIAEALRVTKPGGKVVFVDYHGPVRSNPLRYLMQPVLKWLEPFAMDLWRSELPDFLPDGISPDRISSSFYCGGLYQKIVVAC
jgi:ubiquinone/menaquinone biosynthesis C-methylase UbiE